MNDFKNPLHELAHEFFNERVGLDARERLYELLIKVHNNALEQATQCVGTQVYVVDLGDIRELKYPLP